MTKTTHQEDDGMSIYDLTELERARLDVWTPADERRFRRYERRCALAGMALFVGYLIVRGLS